MRVQEQITVAMNIHALNGQRSTILVPFAQLRNSAILRRLTAISSIIQSGLRMVVDSGIRKIGRLLQTLKLQQALLPISLSVPLALVAQPSLPILQPSAIVLSQSTVPTPLATHSEVACDPHADMSFESAQSAAYTPLRDHTPTSGECPGYWIRFTVQPGASSVGGWILQSEHPWRHADLYSTVDGAVVHLQTGIDIPPQARAVPSGMTALPLPLEGRSTQTFYLRLAGDTTRYGESRSLDASIFPLHDWLLAQRSMILGQGTYAGVIAGLVLYNLILFLAIRERVYLYYVLYVTSFATIWIARTGVFYQHLWPRHFQWNQDYLAYVAAAAIAFSVLFVREFLSTRRRMPRTDSFLRTLFAIAVLSVVVGGLGGVSLLPLPLALLGLAVSFLYAGIGVATLVRGYRPARFFLVAWAALLVGNVTYILMFLRLLPNTFFTYNAAQAGSAIECVLLAFALADRVNLLKGAREERQLLYTLELQEQVKRRTGELSDVVEKLKAASVTDPLTGLSNRRHVDAAIQPWIADLQRSRIRGPSELPQRSLAICLADLDHFKQVNDELGHATGDRVLLSVAGTLRQNVRATAILARWGGEEFLVLDHVTGPYEDILMAERLRHSIMHDTAPVVAETGRPLTLSLGIARFPFSETFPDLLDWDHCLVLADHALYRAKKAGRNRWQCYRPNEGPLRTIVSQRGIEEVRHLLRLHTDEAFSLGLVEIIEQVPAGVGVF
jgi:two-component system, sensor histidine kinase LadS